MRALRENEERYRLLIDGVMGYAIIMLDNEGNVILWTSGAERLFGYRADEIIGRPFSCFFLPEDVTVGRPQHELLVALNEGHFVQDGWRIRKDASHFSAHVSLTPLRNELGDLRGFAKTVHCTTETKNTATQEDR